VRHDVPVHDGAPTADEVIRGYLSGVFPMDVDGAVGFYHCDPRAVIPIDAFRVPASVRRGMRRAGFEARIDTAFDEVVAECGGYRQGGPWLTPRLAAVYGELHRRGFAHSVEIWREGRLAGGLFGVAVGGLFTSESMFHRESDAGSAAIVCTHRRLRARGFRLWDIQMASPHTLRFGAVEVSRERYLELLRGSLEVICEFGDVPIVVDDEWWNPVGWLSLIHI